jgi:DNA invertase Pin-like site-specific DNA recombinase
MHGGHMEETTKHKNPKFQELAKEGLIPEIVIQSLYEDEGWSISKISKQLGISDMTVYRALKEFGIETRDRYKIASEEMHKYWQSKKQSAFESVNIN